MKRSCISKVEGWCYAVFWRINTNTNDNMLRMEELYCEEDAQSVVDSMRLHSHSCSLIGQAAVDGKHTWISPDHTETEFAQQFSAGIKTIALLPLPLHGVLQLASKHQISQTPHSLHHITNFLQQLLPGECASEPAVQSDLFASLSPSLHLFSSHLPTSFTNTLENAATPFHPQNHHAQSESPIHPDFGSLVNNTQHLFENPLEASHFSPNLFGDIHMDDLTQWLADSSELFDAMPSTDTPHTFGVEGVSSSLSSSEGNALHSHGEIETISVTANNDSLLHEFQTESVVGTLGHMHTVAAPWKGLFSELGLDHLLRDEKGASSNCSSISCIEDLWPPSKKRRVEETKMIKNQIQFNGNLCGANGQIRDFGSLKEWMPKPEPGLRVQESFTMDAKSCISTVNLQSRKPNERAKPAKKRAKPGESKKPRPKDRQQIAERINELRDLIPNGAKLSIDALLGRTIKHMDYLQDLSRHADQINQVHEPKLIGQGKGLVQNSSSRNATWAFEVGGSNTLCPIIVEDLAHPCQMLIEMLCEEREYFLEMADIVRGYGLTILKGVMEERNSRIWAQFTVEAKKPVERVRVFMSLMQFFQGTSMSEVATPIEPQKVINSVSPLWGNYQQHVVPIST